jgi:hypothetical protein
MNTLLCEVEADADTISQHQVQVILNWLELDKVFGALSHQNKYALIFALQHTMRSF